MWKVSPISSMGTVRPSVSVTAVHFSKGVHGTMAAFFFLLRLLIFFLQRRHLDFSVFDPTHCVLVLEGAEKRRGPTQVVERDGVPVGAEEWPVGIGRHEGADGRKRAQGFA
jgi:hypothetical protein